VADRAYKRRRQNEDNYRDPCVALTRRVGDSTAQTTEGFGGKQVTRAWLSLVLAPAWADHHAEAAMYLRLNGVLPPTAKK
jgi:hypothetical protein